VSKGATAATMAIAPILSVIMAFRRDTYKESGVTMFIFLTSSAMAFLIYFFLFLENTFIPQKYIDAVKMVLLSAYTVEDFRFPLMCLLAIVVVGDIRGMQRLDIPNAPVKSHD
ncbi:hypothetical protein PENTCL1PPCAC_21611, partial [Pristionchus entomophagus]